MLMTVRFCSPPYSRSARARAVSVLPTPDGPRNRNTPIGLRGSVSLARAVRMARATASSAWFWPTTRSRRRSSRARIDRISSDTMRPTGMPVQFATTAATAWASTSTGISGRFALQLAQGAAGLGVFGAQRRDVLDAYRTGSPPHPPRGRGPGPPRSGRAARGSGRPGRAPPPSGSEAPRARPRPGRAGDCSSAIRPVSPPVASSRRRMAISASSRSTRRRRSSIASGVAAWAMATRAQAVSSRLIDLSGSWRPAT